MKTFHTQCVECHHELDPPEEKLGKKGPCPHCGTEMELAVGMSFRVIEDVRPPAIEVIEEPAPQVPTKQVLQTVMDEGVRSFHNNALDVFWCLVAIGCAGVASLSFLAMLGDIVLELDNSNVLQQQYYALSSLRWVVIAIASTTGFFKAVGQAQ